MVSGAFFGGVLKLFGLEERGVAAGNLAAKYYQPVTR